MARSRLHIRYINNVDARLKPEILVFARWLRTWYQFPIAFHLQLIGADHLIDYDGTPCALRWWHNSANSPFVGQLAVGSFTNNLELEGDSVAFPTVIASIGRLVKYYSQVISNAPIRTDFAEVWGDKLLDAYIEGAIPPYPCKHSNAAINSCPNNSLQRVSCRGDR